MAAMPACSPAGRHEEALLAMRGQAYVLAARTLGRTRDVEDVVQNAYLDALRHLRGGSAPRDLKAWFLAVVVNVAREHLRSEIRRRRREDAVHAPPEAGPGAATEPELVRELAARLASLDEKFRLPISLYATKHGLAGQFGTVEVWSSEGKLLTANAVGATMNGRGVAMDRDGNIYSTIGSGTLPAGQKVLDGIAGSGAGLESWVWCGRGTLVKFRGQGDGKFPLSVGESAVKLGAGQGEVRPGALWAYGGITNQTRDCMCHSISYDMDYFARHWIPANQLGSVMVIDSNGNRVARLGRYGNVDDTDADVKAGKDGLRFVWSRAVAVSDTALYVTDTGNHRILKAALKYAAEEVVPLP
jgi:hypothetical protein